MGRGMQYFQCMQQFVICQHLIVNHPKYDRNDFNPEIGPSTLGRFADTAGDSHVMEEFEGLWAGYVLNGLQTDAGLATVVAPRPGNGKNAVRLLTLPLDEYHLPILPPLKANINSEDINVLIRSFLVIHYRKLK